jgi:LacI family transcriptional regulator
MITLKDIADQAGVSITTVSRVLNGRESGIPIREETRTKILSIAAELGYRPNLMARALRGSRSSLLGVLATNITSVFHSQILRGINEAAVQRAYRVFLGHVQRQADIAVDYGSMFEQSHADGILIVGELAGDIEAFNALASQHRYVVTISGQATQQKSPGVYADSVVGAQLAMEHLWELGHRRIVCITDPSLHDAQARSDTYQHFMQQHGAGHLIQIMYTARALQPSLEAGQRFFAALPDRGAPTAIFAVTDSIAIGLLQAAYQAGISIPDQISIMGYDDIDFAAFTIPPLTTIRQSGFTMGQIGANLLIDMIEQERDGAVIDDVVLTPTLVVRQSTRAV